MLRLDDSNESAYCVRCRTRKEMSKIERGILDNGAAFVRGYCKDCDTKMIKMTGRKSK